MTTRRPSEPDVPLPINPKCRDCNQLSELWIRANGWLCRDCAFLRESLGTFVADPGGMRYLTAGADDDGGSL